MWPFRKREYTGNHVNAEAMAADAMPAEPRYDGTFSVTLECVNAPLSTVIEKLDAHVRKCEEYRSKLLRAGGF